MDLIRGCGWTGLLLGGWVLVGCGESAGEPTVAVTGTVTQKGTPVEGAIVSFIGADGQTAVGLTDAAGKYSLTTRKKDDGAIPGDYKVSVTKFDGPKPTAGGTTQLKEGELHSADYTGEEAEAPPPQNLLPAKYAHPDTSGFTATVSAGGTPHNFDLEG